MNMYLGGFAGTDGGWPSLSALRIYLKTSELSAPPAKIFVLLDMRPDAVNFGNFMTDMAGYPSSAGTYQLVDLPGLAHNRACSFSFADNHVEMKRWRDPRTAPIQAYTGAAIPSPGNVDVAWLQDHSTRQNDLAPGGCPFHSALHCIRLPCPAPRPAQGQRPEPSLLPRLRRG